MVLTPQLVLILALFVWVIVLTVVLFRFHVFYQRINRGGKSESLIKLIEDMMRNHDKTMHQLKKNSENIEELAQKNSTNIQKVGVYRFNPFKDTGGDQSFIITFLDGNNSGVIISGLHARTGVRWYAKSITRGKGEGYELSADEEKALQSAAHLT